MQRRLSILFVLVLLFQTVTSSLIFPAQIAAEGSNSIFKGYTVTDDQGQVDESDLPTDTNLQMQIDWSAQGSDVSEGSSETFSLDAQYIIQSDQSGALIDEQTEAEVGSFEASTDGVVTITFNEQVEEHPDATGSFAVDFTVLAEEEEASESGEESETEETADPDNKEADQQEQPAEETEEGNAESEDQGKEESNNEPDNQKQEPEAGEASEDVTENEETEEEEATPEEEQPIFEEGAEITENIVTKVTLFQHLKDEQKKLEAGEEIVVDRPYDDFNVSIQYELELAEDHTYGKESTYTIELPELLTANKDQESQEVTAEDGTVLGNLTVEGTTATVTFNEKIETEESLTASVSIPAAFDADYTGPAEGETVKLQGAGEETLDFPVTFIPEGEAEQEANEEESETEEASASSFNVTLQGDKEGFNLEIGSITDLEGNAYDEENLLELNPLDQFRLGIKWTLDDGHDYEEGDTESFELPSGIKMIDAIEDELRDDNGELVATYTISTDNQVEITFTDYVETHSNVQGWIEIVSTLNEEEVDYEDGEVIIHPIGEEDEIRLPIDASDRDKTIEKSVEPTGYNDDEINWSVTINKNQNSLTNATLTDVFPEGTEYKEESLVVTKLNVDLNGNVLGDLEEVDISDENFGEGQLPLGDIQDAYRIDYVTTVTDSNETNFNNQVTLSDDDLEDVTADASVNIDRGEPINKSAVSEYDPKTRIIEWEIEFNYDEQNLEDVTLSDSWEPEGQLQLVEDSLTFTEVKIDENGNADETENVGLPDGATLQKVTDGFEVTGITTDKSYKVTYQTVVTDRVLDDFEVENTAGFGGEIATDGTGVGQYYGSKSALTINYADKTVDWTIEVNHDEYPMHNISIEDTLGEGLTLLEDTVEVTVDGEDYDGQTITGDNPFTIDFPGDFSTEEKIVITYQTKYDPNNLPDDNTAYNTAAITWTPTEDGDEIRREVKANTPLNWSTGEVNWKNGEYNPETKEITWTIHANYIENEIENLIIRDNPEGNQVIVPDSIKVTESTITGEDTAEWNYIGELDPSKIASVDEDSNSLQVNVGKTNNVVSVEFKTTLEGLSNIQENYENTAEILDGTDNIGNVDASVGIAKHNTYADKSGYQDGKQVHWSVAVNLGQQQIDNLALQDEISDNQEYLTDTITVYHASVDNDGNVTKGEAVSTDEYELMHTEGEQTFTVEWNNTVDRPYVVEYSTLFFAGHNDKVTNNYNVTGDNIIEEGHTEGEDSVTIQQLSSGGGSGEAGYLIVDKIDVTNGAEEKLAGAEFDLIDSDTGNVLKSGTTDENGQIDFGRLLFGDYELHERVVPDGYVTPEERQNITIDTAYDVDEDPETYTITVENFVPVHAIQLLKTDDLDNPIPGVEFTLYDREDNEIDTAKTNINGEIEFENLPGPGTFYLKETDVPEGYEENEDRHEVTVGEMEQAPVETTIVNDRVLTDVSGTKTWEDGENQDGNRPDSITVNLLADGREVDSEEVTADDNWEYSFTDLPAYDDGEEIKYTIEEEAVEGYDTEINGYDITNSYTPEVTNVTVTKEWADGNNQDGIRPESVEVQLFANDEEIDELETITLNESNSWTDEWSDLPVYENGKTIDYTVQEIEGPEEYDISIDDEDHGNIVITNSYEPETTEIAVNKEWNDADNQDGVRPNNVTVNLLGNGEIVSTTVLDDENGWQHTFTNLPVYENGNEINYRVTENTVTDYQPDIEFTGTEEEPAYTITNSYTPEKTSVTVTKAWDDADNQDGNRPDSIEVQLYANGNEVGDPVKLNAPDWTHTWPRLDANAAGEPIEYTVQELDVDEEYTVTVDDADHGNIIITNSYEPELTEVPVTKVWDDADNQDGDRPTQITLNLLNDRAEIVKSAVVQEQEGNEWNYTFEDLPKYEDGVEINYSVTEDFVSDYSTTVEENDEGVHVVTNDYTPEETSVTVTKGWNDGSNQDGERPESIEVQLTADGEEIRDTQTLSEENNWTYTWKELDLNADGEPIDYSVEEINVPEGYTPSINDADHGNIVVTNSYTPEVTEIPVTKEWDDGEDRDRVRPNNVTVNLLADGEIVRQAVLNEARDWKHTFTDLPVFTDGEEINYIITENAVEGYSTTIEENEDGVHVITNEYTPEKTTVTVTKNWDDANNQDGIRPGTIEVQLLANGEPTGETVELNAEEDWTYTWEGLPLNEAGEAITYSVAEPNVPKGYEVSVNDEDHGNIILTNSHTPSEIDVEVTKTWNDANNQDGIRSEEVRVQLYADEEVVGDPVTLNDENDWSNTWEDLDEYADGEPIAYTVEELDVQEGYEVGINDEDPENIVVTNSYIPSVIDVEVTKVWDDANDQDGIRPDNVAVQLYAGEEEVGDPVTLNEENSWSNTWEELDEYANGEPIAYTVEELDVPEGYEVEVNAEDPENIVVTNSYTPSVIDVEVTKDWDDANNQDGIRPEVIEVQLTANGEDQGEPVELSADNNWTYTWEGLDEREAGTAIDYSVVELTELPEYETSVNDEDHGNIIITNSYTPETTEVTGTKTWDDADNQDGNRPDTNTVNLLANGEQMDSVEVTEEEDWTYSFTDLPKFEAGEEIVYTVTENTVEDYTQTIDGHDITNHYTPGQTAVTVTKNWDDANNQDGNRPDSIEVQLTADGESQGEVVELSADNNWTHTWDELDEKAAGEAITYSVVELTELPEHETSINDENHGNIIITNSYTPSTTSVNVVKVWNDEDNEEARSESITVNLLADDQVVDSVDLNEENNWEANFTNLDEYAAGEKVVYSIEEVEVDGFVTEAITGNAEDGFVITNTPAKVSVGDYVWFDANEDGLQDDTDVPLEGVVLTIEDEDGNPVTDVYGNPVGPTTTDENGYYIFEDLPIDETYTVRIDREASEEALKGYVPTLHEVGDDNTIDSSTWEATSRHLTEDGEHDPTLDFGFVIVEDPEIPVEEDPEQPETPGEEDPDTPEESSEDPAPEPQDPSEPETEEEPAVSDDEGEEGESTSESTDEDHGQDRSGPGQTAEVSGTPETDTTGGTPDTPDKEKEEGTLPNTATNMFNLLIAGLALLVSGGLLVAFRRRS